MRYLFFVLFLFSSSPSFSAITYNNQANIGLCNPGKSKVLLSVVTEVYNYSISYPSGVTTCNTWNGNSNSYVRTFASGTPNHTTLSSYREGAEGCPVGSAMDSNYVCKPIDPTCPVGKIKDASGLYCVPSTCPVGSTRDPITLHCLPIKCPIGQTLISDGTCQTTCPPNSSRVDKICRYDCGHWTKDTCGKYLDSKGNHCKWSYGNLFTSTFHGSCVTEAQANDDIEKLFPLKLSPTSLPKIFGEPEYPDYEPMPIKPYEPTTIPIPKPANDPAYVPPVEPTPVTPIPIKPVVEPIPAPKPANDPDYVPTIEPVTPLTPDIVPYSPPAPSPAPVPEPAPAPLPAPEPLPVPAPSPAPAPAPAPSPLPSPEPAPAPAPSPLPLPKPDYVFDPLPDPVIDPATGEPVPVTPSPYPAIEPMPNVSMPAVPDVLDFSIDDMDKFRYNATTMSYNILDQVDNVQNTFTNSMNILNQGFPPVQLPTGSCGSSMAFDFYGKHIDLCPPLANTSAQFAPLFQLLIFMVGLIASIKIFISGLRD